MSSFNDACLVTILIVFCLSGLVTLKNYKMKIDWINSWAKGNKKDDIYDISIRIGRITLLEIYCNPGVDHRFIILNFGFKI